MEQGSDGLTVYVREPAVEGAANAALIKLLAEYYKVPKTTIEIIRGHTSKHKLVEINRAPNPH